MGELSDTALYQRRPMSALDQRPSRVAAAGRPGEVTDERLMRRIAGGEHETFEQLYERHATAAFSLARAMLRDQRAAEDVCQEAFLAVWRNAAAFDATRGAVRPWLLQIVRNGAIDAIRHRRVPTRRLDVCPDILEHEPAAEQTQAQALGNIDAAAVRVTLRALPAEQRQAIALAYFGGLTHREIADVLELPLGTVKGRLRLGLEKLRCQASLTVSR